MEPDWPQDGTNNRRSNTSVSLPFRLSEILIIERAGQQLLPVAIPPVKHYPPRKTFSEGKLPH